jgi:hypothetical protein
MSKTINRGRPVQPSRVRKETIPTFLYHPRHGARIFQIMPGEALPVGWYDTPAAFAGLESETNRKRATPATTGTRPRKRAAAATSARARSGVEPPLQ